jgi:hypothetical protein
MTLARSVREFFQSPFRSRDERLFPSHTQAFQQARIIIRCYYVCLFFDALITFDYWPNLLQREEIAALWPVVWLEGVVPLATGILAILLAFLAGTFAAVFFPEKRWARILAFAGVFQFDAMRNSFGKIGHSYHLFVLTAFLLIFLPTIQAGDRGPSRRTRQQFLVVFWGCQAMIMLTYTMAGLCKVQGALMQILAREVHAFHPDALPRLIADRLLETNSQSLVGPWLINHRIVAWPMYLFTLYIEVFSIWVAFRPSLHRMWALLLIAFHVGSMLSMTITFERNCLLLGLFFLVSPFSPSGVTWREFLTSLPPVDLIFGEHLLPEKMRRVVKALKGCVPNH